MVKVFTVRWRVTGIDYSAVSVKKSREVNAKAIAAGRCKVLEGSAAELPFEEGGLSGNNAKWEKMIEGMHTYTPDELRTHLTAAGFRDIAVRRDEQRHWLCVTGVK